jgi:hypothetical protein
MLAVSAQILAAVRALAPDETVTMHSVRAIDENDVWEEDTELHRRIIDVFLLHEGAV